MFAIDVSNWQGSPDYARVASCGVAAVIAKASQGTWRDPCYNYNKAAIPGAGLHAGAYHFLDPRMPGAQQADTFAEVVDPGAAHYLDVEGNRSLDVAGFVERYAYHFPTKTLGIYTGRDFWKISNRPDGGHIGPLWVAGYQPNAYVTKTGGASIPELFSHVGKANGGVPFGGWTDFSIMQFTDSALVEGISGAVDADWVKTPPLEWSIEDMAISADDAHAIAAAFLNFPSRKSDPNGTVISMQTLIERVYDATQKTVLDETTIISTYPKAAAATPTASMPTSSSVKA